MEEDRPAKRIKTDDQVNHTNLLSTSTTTSREKHGSGNQQESRQGTPKSGYWKGKQMPKSQDKDSLGPVRTFSQPSVICTGDRGIFVTCDKGREKKSLLELHDLVQQCLEDAGIDTMGMPLADQTNLPLDEQSLDATKTLQHVAAGIEADIESELASLKNNSNEQSKAVAVPKSIQLITLDIPCVSFLRFPVGSSVDPVDVVHKLCASAADPSTAQRSRFVMRLTPVSMLAKVLSQGVTKICNEVLPKHFGADQEGEIKSVKFAIRPTIRNNDKLDRDQVIKEVADHVQELGNASHKVDLKQYEKGILVEVYRGWAGICVVNNTNGGPYTKGFEELKRFNLAEIYAKR